MQSWRWQHHYASSATCIGQVGFARLFLLQSIFQHSTTAFAVQQSLYCTNCFLKQIDNCRQSIRESRTERCCLNLLAYIDRFPTLDIQSKQPYEQHICKSNVPTVNPIVSCMLDTRLIRSQLCSMFIIHAIISPPVSSDIRFISGLGYQC